MAQEVQVLLICDAEGEKHEADASVPFEVAGVRYEADLCVAHQERLRVALEKAQAAYDKLANPWIEVARRAGPVRRSPSHTRKARASRAASSDTSNARQWARLTGLDVPEKGPIRKSVLDAWVAAGRPAA